MKVRILASASRDLIQGQRFYDGQVPGLGDRFLDALYADIDALAVTAGIHVRCFDHYYRAPSKRFPFAIYYRIEARTVLVCAILDTRRNPASTRRRLL